jgi:hypothetical protein
MGQRVCQQGVEQIRMSCFSITPPISYFFSGVGRSRELGGGNLQDENGRACPVGGWELPAQGEDEGLVDARHLPRGALRRPAFFEGSPEGEAPLWALYGATEQSY